jgi:enoyl-CoA hydratase/carnithine racemase
MGLNEVKLGVPVPFPGDCILRQIVGTRYAKEIMEEGEFFPPERSLQMGMVDYVLPKEQVFPKSIEKATELGAMPSKAFMMIKRNRVEQIEAYIKKYLDQKEQYFLECWFSEEAQEHLSEAMKKF